LGGLLLPLAFAPFEAPFLAIIALALLFAAWSNATPGQAFRRGYLFGLGQFGLGVSWVYVSMHDYGGAGILEAAGLTALFALFLALYPGLAGWLAVRCLGVNRQPPRPSALAEEGSGEVTQRAFHSIAVFPAAWILLEWFRGWFLSGFPWLQIGYSQIDTPLSGLAPVFGVYGVGWALAVLAGLLLAAPRWSGRRRWGGLIAVLGLVGLSESLGHIEWTRPGGEPFKVALLQGNVPQDVKWQPEFQRATLQTYMDMTREHWDAKLIVWPETAVPAFYQQVKDSFLAGLEAEARDHGTDLLIGVPYYNAAEDHYYNAVAALGQTPGFYFKRHLVPFGEFLPLRPLLGWILDILQIPLGDFASGNGRQPPLIAAGHPLAASICYEDIFGSESLVSLPQAAYLVNVTNDAWFGNSIAPHQHAQMARMRALETGRWMLRATNTGVTAFIDPKGAVSLRAPLFRKASLAGSITPMQGSTPYILWGDGPVIVGAFVLLGSLAWRHHQSFSKPMLNSNRTRP
jgi:apolipoprotein N-acyltransferase